MAGAAEQRDGPGAASGGGAPRALRACLAARGLVAPDAPWRALRGGRTNRLWRVGAAVVKLYRSDRATPLFPNDPQAERAALAAFAPLGLAPRPHALVETPLGPALVYAHVPGTAWDGDGAALAACLGRLHRAAARPAAFGLRASGGAALEAMTARLLAALPASAARRLPPAGRRAAAVPPVSAPVPIHCDVVPTNVIVSAAGPVLIDWQCPALGDPCEDLASVLSPAMQALYRGAPLSPAAEEAFLAACPDRAAAARYRRLAPAFHRRMAAYCLWRGAQGAADYAAAAALEIAALERARAG